jgi:hypothetical protein
MSKSEKSDRQQLLEARAEIERQIEILQGGPLVIARGGSTQFEPVIAELTATLKEIEDSLAALEEDDA